MKRKSAILDFTFSFIAGGLISMFATIYLVAKATEAPADAHVEHIVITIDQGVPFECARVKP